MNINMSKTIHDLQISLIGIRGGTISPSLIDQTKVFCYDQNMPLKAIASTSRKPNGIEITPYDSNLTNQIAISLKAAGFNAYVFSKQAVMVSVEPPSGDQKKEVANKIKQLGEEAKIAIRNIRKKNKTTIESDKLTEDERKKHLKELQDETDASIESINHIITDKIKSL